MAIRKDIVIEQGKTFMLTVRWENSKLVYKPITGIAKTAPVLITCPNHGVPNGWVIAIVSVKGMSQINASNTPPKDSDYYPATVISANTLEINAINAADFSDYISGGYIQYYEPRSLAGVTARMKIKNKIGGSLLYELTTANGRIVVDDTNKITTITIPASDTEGFTWTKGVYDLEFVEPTVPETVCAVLAGSVTVFKEVTTS